MNHYRIKYWLYKQDQWIISGLVILLTVVTTVALIDISNDDQWATSIEFRAWVAIIIGLITLLFAFMRQKHNDMSVFFSLFDKFNEKYDKLNNDLNIIRKVSTDTDFLQKMNISVDEPPEEVTEHIDFEKRLKGERQFKDVLDDYLNLCAEEYLAYKSGYIPPEVMKYWFNGMVYFFKNDYIREYCKKELNNDSYYDFREFALNEFKKIERE